MLLCAQAAITSCLYIATGALSEILTNNAAAALMYPIAAAAGDKLGVDPKLISVSIMLGASSAFMSPFGYQTNLMVYGAGNYKTMEFIKYGAGLKIWLWIVATVVMGLDDYLEVLLGISLGFAAAVLLMPFAPRCLPQGCKDKMSQWFIACMPKRKSEIYPKDEGHLPLPQTTTVA
uniref:Citrate transporter-like domain-containing protein n=1 Tax=Dunaliella tertiolecta TaxID=3047 RepID=A0A7S3R0T2_DUNTE